MKIMFFDIDGTLSPERIGAEIPESTIRSIHQAQKNGHLMFINTGRCMQNIEPQHRAIGFDGIVAGCGTNLYLGDKELFHIKRNPEICRRVLLSARAHKIDIVFESKERISYDHSRTLSEHANSLIFRMRERGYDLDEDVDLPGFVFDKFIIWDEPGCERDAFFDEIREWYQIIDRGNRFYEFVPHGYSKATGIQAILDHYHLPLSAAHAVGDSTNDLPMLDYVPHSIAMGNSSPASLFDRVEYVTADVDHDGIEQALRHYGFI